MQLVDTEENYKNEMMKTRIPSSVRWCFELFLLMCFEWFSVVILP